MLDELTMLTVPSCPADSKYRPVSWKAWRSCKQGFSVRQGEAGWTRAASTYHAQKCRPVAFSSEKAETRLFHMGSVQPPYPHGGIIRSRGDD